MSSFLRVLPNIITASRLFFAAAFLLLLILTDRAALASPAAIDPQKWKLDWAFVLFVIGGLTDVIDGPLARRWNVTSKFGRSFDPFVDKILSGGGFILLAWYGPQLTLVAWWMVAVILARELFVTLVRSLSESQGKAFGATWAGKLKMFLQSFAIGTCIIYVAHCQHQTWAVWVRNISVWTAVIFTALSAVIYLPRMKHISFKKRP